MYLLCYAGLPGNRQKGKCIVQCIVHNITKINRNYWIDIVERKLTHSSRFLFKVEIEGKRTGQDMISKIIHFTDQI